MALVGASYGSGATIISDGMFTVGRDQRQGPVRKMRGLIAGAKHSAVKLASRWSAASRRSPPEATVGSNRQDREGVGTTLAIGRGWSPYALARVSPYRQV
jgi:hypothetical protein